MVLIGTLLVAKARDSRAEQRKAEIVRKADSLFPQRHRPPVDKTPVTFDPNRESRAADAVVYWANSTYVVRLVFADDGSLARVELFPEPLLYNDSWTSVPDTVELQQGEVRWLLTEARLLQPTGDPVSVHQPPDGCFQSGPNLYCGDTYELANVRTYCREGYRVMPIPPVSLREVTIAYKQSVAGIVSETKGISGSERHLKVGAIWYRLLKDRDPQLFATAEVGSMVTLTSFGCAGNELTCNAFPASTTPPKH